VHLSLCLFRLSLMTTLTFKVDQLISQNHLFKRSIILIKAWCYYESRILGAHHGLISTYALETLVLYIFHVFNNRFAGPLEVKLLFLLNLHFFNAFGFLTWKSFHCICRYSIAFWSFSVNSIGNTFALVSGAQFQLVHFLMWLVSVDPVNDILRTSAFSDVSASCIAMAVSEFTFWNVTALSPREDGGQILLSQLFLEVCSSVYAVFPSQQENQEQSFVSKYFNVIDPLRTNNNLGRSVSKGIAPN